MADISYTPTFHDVPWEDRKSRVTAAGPDGFNGKFNAIASDLRQFSTVVTRIGGAIDASNTPPSPQQQRLSFTPVLRTTSSSTGGWSYDANGVVSALSGEILGVANLTLPDRLRLTSVRVVGSIGRNSFGSGGGGVSLVRTPLRLVVPPPDPEPLAINNSIPGTGAFDLQIPVTASRALIDTSVFRYVFTANYTTITFGGLSIEAVHLTFAPPS